MRIHDSPNDRTAQRDDQLLRRARLPVQHWHPAQLDAQLQSIQREHGTSLATAWLYQTLCQHPEHREFISQFQSAPLPTATDGSFPLMVCIVPGAFYREHPRTGAGGARLREQLHLLGISTQVIPIRSTGTLAENSQIIRRYLSEHTDQPLAIISLSKGSADIKCAMRDEPSAFANVRLWYSISGTLSGAQLVDWVQQRAWARLVNRFYFRMTRRDQRFFSDLAYGSRGELNFPLCLPDGMTLVHVAGFPLRHHTRTRLARVWYRRFEPFGPTDSAIRLGDLLHLPGYVLPVWGVDHYFKDSTAVGHIARGFYQHATALAGCTTGRETRRSIDDALPTEVSCEAISQRNPSLHDDNRSRTAQALHESLTGERRL